MRILLFGGSGMVGQGVLRECLLDPTVTEIFSVGRSPLPVETSPRMRELCNAKLRERTLPNLFDFETIAPELAGFDACFFCLGVSSFRMQEADYRRITEQLTLLVARALLPDNPAMCFIYVSGAGTDPQSKTMWASVKGETELALLGMGFRDAVMFRPGLIVPLHGIRSKTAMYDAVYRLLSPVLGLLARSKRLATTTEAVGKAMLRVAKEPSAQKILDNEAINRLAQ